MGRRELAEFDNEPLEFSPVSFGDEGYYRCVVSARTPEFIALETVTSQPTLVTGNNLQTHKYIIIMNFLIFLYSVA